ncbi:uncharacterized protein ACMZJ9_009875 [Mantella aurantiaca]
MLKKKCRVAICSRDSEQNYEWLKDFLERRMCKNTRIEARPVYITNNTCQFQEEVSSGYDFAILYHTKKRGRINLTNVTDSLYDDELGFLYRTFGQKKVVLVIDDLENSDNKERDRILKRQEDLGKHARELFLFTQEDKICTEFHLNGMENRTVKAKLRNLKKYIKKGKRGKSKPAEHTQTSLLRYAPHIPGGLRILFLQSVSLCMCIDASAAIFDLGADYFTLITQPARKSKMANHVCMCSGSSLAIFDLGADYFALIQRRGFTSTSHHIVPEEDFLRVFEMFHL